MNIKGNAIVLTDGKFNTKSAKTAHGLIRGSNRFRVIGVIDNKISKKYIHLDKNGKIDLSNKKSDIKVHSNLKSFIKLNIKVDYCIIGVASAGGLLPENMRGDLIDAMDNGMSIINGLHSMLNDDKQLVNVSKKIMFISMIFESQEKGRS